MLGKKLVRDKINETSRRELITRATASESLCRFTRIHAVLHEPHILRSLCKEFPGYRRQTTDGRSVDWHAVQCKIVFIVYKMRGKDRSISRAYFTILS